MQSSMDSGRHRGDSFSSLSSWDQAALTQNIDFTDRRGSTASSSSFDSWTASISFESPATPVGPQHPTSTDFNGYKGPGDSFEVVQDASQMDLYGHEFSGFEGYGSTLAQSWLSLPSSAAVGHSCVHTTPSLKPSPLPDVYKSHVEEEEQGHHADFLLVNNRHHPMPIVRSCATPSPSQEIVPAPLLTPSSYAESSDACWQMDMNQGSNDDLIPIKPEYDNLVMTTLSAGYEQLPSAAPYLWLPNQMDQGDGLKQGVTMSPGDMMQYQQQQNEDYFDGLGEAVSSSSYNVSSVVEHTRRRRGANSSASGRQQRCRKQGGKVGKVRRSSTVASSAARQRKAGSPGKLDRKQDKRSKAVEDALVNGEGRRTDKKSIVYTCNAILMSSKVEARNSKHVQVGEHWVCIQRFARHEHLTRHRTTDKHRDSTLNTLLGPPYRIMGEDGTVFQPPHPSSEGDEDENEMLRNSHGYERSNTGIDGGDLSSVNASTNATDCAIHSSCTPSASVDAKRARRFEDVWCPFTDCPKNDLFNKRDPKRGKGSFGGIRYDNLYAHMKKTHFTRTGREDDHDMEHNERNKRTRNSLERNNRKTQEEARDVGYEWLFLQARADKTAENMAGEAKAAKEAQALAKTQRHGPGPNLLARRMQVKSECPAYNKLTASFAKPSMYGADGGQAWGVDIHDWIAAATGVTDEGDLAALIAARDMYVSRKCCWSESYMRGHRLLKVDLPGLADFLRESGCCIAPDEADGKGKRAANRAAAAAARANNKKAVEGMRKQLLALNRS